MWRTYRLVGLLGLSSTPATDGSLGHDNSTYIALGSPGGYGGDIVSLYPAGETPAPGGSAMIVLVSGATRFPRSADVGHLIVPRAWNDPAALDLQPGCWAMESGGFRGFDEGAYMRMLEAYQPYHAYQGYHGCRFVTAPDVVADAAATLRRWPFWARLIRGLGQAPAFVAQDGLTADRVPWDELGALFIGGTTDYKESVDVRALCGYAKSRGVWVHWGRVNGARRYELAKKAGADSIDGTGFSIAPDTNIPLVKEWHRAIDRQPELGL